MTTHLYPARTTCHLTTESETDASFGDRQMWMIEGKDSEAAQMVAVRRAGEGTV